MRKKSVILLGIMLGTLFVAVVSVFADDNGYIAPSIVGVSTAAPAGKALRSFLGS